MKIITFINDDYIDLAYNLYLQLERFNRHRDFIVFCSDEETRLNLLVTKFNFLKIVISG
jgi:hypothetical protein